MDNPLIDDASAHFAASKNRGYQERVRQRFSTLIGFLQSHDLTTRIILPEGVQPDATTKIMRADLTDEGDALLSTAYHKWLRGIDRGKPISDISILEKTLRDQRR